MKERPQAPDGQEPEHDGHHLRRQPVEQALAQGLGRPFGGGDALLATLVVDIAVPAHLVGVVVEVWVLVGGEVCFSSSGCSFTSSARRETWRNAFPLVR
jgi:uncharacterized membrane protein YedE/YeeE